MQPVHDSLADTSVAAPEQLSASNSHMALQEFSHHGQAGLDDLLDALDGGLEVRPSYSALLFSCCIAC